MTDLATQAAIRKLEAMIARTVSAPHGQVKKRRAELTAFIHRMMEQEVREMELPRRSRAKRQSK